MINTINLVLQTNGALTISSATSDALGVSNENGATTVNIDISAVSSIASYTHYLEILTPKQERYYINASIAGNTITGSITNVCLDKEGFALLQLRSESGTVIVKSSCVKLYVQRSVNAYDEGVQTDAWVASIEAAINTINNTTIPAAITECKNYADAAEADANSYTNQKIANELAAFIAGQVSLAGNLTVGGDLTVTGKITSVESGTISTTERFIQLMRGNTGAAAG